jgi:iron complex outermembrane recepter protein
VAKDGARIFSKNLLIMKQWTTCCVLLCCTLAQAQKNQPPSFNDTASLQAIEVLAIRAAAKDPFAKTNISKKEIEQQNLGQDIPFLLNQTPSVVVNSDAGNGVGYTGIRIRGTDATRINFTLNGIPYNDAESQGTFFVNLPDFASSLSSLQIQRGVGTSTNGTGAFGATVNMATNEVNEKFYAEINNSAGSFNTWKNTFKVGSGLIGKHFTIDARLSNITSNGYVERASSNLKAYYLSTAWMDAKNSFRLNIFSGKEKTYQAWNGVSEAMLTTNRRFNVSGTEQPGKPYENETDNYQQTHYQFFFNRSWNTHWKSNITLFYTRGAGYYENYKANQRLANYGLPEVPDGSNSISNTDLVRQLWLDNDFYGNIVSVQHEKGGTRFTTGFNWTNYDGTHFGKVIWTKIVNAAPPGYKWYNLTANKTDVAAFAKWSQQIGTHWQTYADVQLRQVNYTTDGFRDNPTLAIDYSKLFFNPKIGLTYNRGSWQAHGSYAVANKEPNRNDFEAGAAQQPVAETLHNWEMGIEKKHRNYGWSANVYYMLYRNQLVLTGQINDVGAYTRTNIPNSYRLGLEIAATYRPTKWLHIAGNATISENKIKNFTEFIDDFDNGGQLQKFYRSTTIGFSPALIAGGTITLKPSTHAEISLLSKYVSRQYLDNTAQRSRSLNAYFVQDARMSYVLPKKLFKQTTFILQLNNIFNKEYEANGYTFSYIAGGLVTENFYFPMATFNWMLGINIAL